jgi:mannose-1-phosphate guanylyltransferase
MVELMRSEKHSVNHQKAWAVVLAGGDGTRLRSFTRPIAGDDRPKQFCSLYGGRTLLAHTRARLAHAIAPERTLFTLVRHHEAFYSEELADVKPSHMVVQPSNKGTTVAIINSLLRITSLAGDPIVAFFPTDHHYSREQSFVSAVRLALNIVSTRLDTVILLGADAEHPEVEYGWIEPGANVECAFTSSLLAVRRFWEKPSTPVAQALLAHGCLWNTFVMIGRASAFLDLLNAAVPRVMQVLESQMGLSCAAPTLPSEDEAYATLHPGDFSQQVLSVSTGQLAVLRLGNIGWSDLGTPERVRRAMTQAGLRSHWPGSGQNDTIEELSKTSVFLSLDLIAPTPQKEAGQLR